MTVIQAEQEQECVPLSPAMSMSMTEPGRAGTEILTSITRYVNKYDCDPGRTVTEICTCVTRYVSWYDCDPGRAGTEIRTSVTRYVSEYD